jgi:hypothetical protein
MLSSGNKKWDSILDFGCPDFGLIIPNPGHKFGHWTMGICPMLGGDGTPSPKI